MIKRGKYYVPPPEKISDFKTLFLELVAVGAGRPADSEGSAVGQWTPELLTEELSLLDGDKGGADLRSVQNWFQQNSKAPNPENLGRLAKVFGCGDPDAIGEWRKTLIASHALLVKKRKQQNEKQGNQDPAPARTSVEPAPTAYPPAAPQRPKGLALLSEAMFRGQSSLNLPIAIWASLALLWLLAFILGVHSITYSPVEGLNKQVGFIWSPAWNVGEPIFLPLLLIAVSELLWYWKTKARILIDPSMPFELHQAAWAQKVRSFTASYWAIFFICFVLIFIVQWTGVYLRPLLSPDVSVSHVDWITVGLVRPDAISVREAVILSLIGFLYSGMLYWFYFVAWLLLYTVASDFAELGNTLDTPDREKIRRIGTKIVRTAFRCTVSGVMIALCIKLNASYLISDAETIIGWLINDALFALGFVDTSWAYMKGSPSPFLTSFLLAFVTVFVFGVCFVQVTSVMEISLATPQLQTQARVYWRRMIGLLVLLCTSFLLIGQFKGFSLLLLVGIPVSIASYSWRFELKEDD